MISKDLEKLSLNMDAISVARDAWVFQNSGIIHGTDEALAAMTDDL